MPAAAEQDEGYRLKLEKLTAIAATYDGPAEELTLDLRGPPDVAGVASLVLAGVGAAAARFRGVQVLRILVWEKPESLVTSLWRLKVAAYATEGVQPTRSPYPSILPAIPWALIVGGIVVALVAFAVIAFSIAAISWSRTVSEAPVPVAIIAVAGGAALIAILVAASRSGVLKAAAQRLAT